MSDNREEAISVSIRIRPLKKKQRDQLVWKKVPNMNAITQTMGDDRQTPVPNSSFQFGKRIMHPKAQVSTNMLHSFITDNVLDEPVETADLYDKIGKRIVNSVVDGINGRQWFLIAGLQLACDNISS